MRKKAVVSILLLILCLVAAGCGKQESKAPVPDGTYEVKVRTDSTMFHINEAKKGMGTLTVKDGKMTVHISLASKSIVHLFCGKAEDAQKDGAKLIEPTSDKVTYSDGITEEVYGFDIPVAVLDQEFDVAIIGTHGNWYDHKITVSSPALEK